MSDRTAVRLTRILAMLPWVIAHQGATVDEVCDRFGYTERQLIEDLDLVFVCGLPGYGPGDLIVAYVDDDRVVVDTADYFSGAPRLSPGEAVALLAAGLTVIGSGQGSTSLVTAVDKLSSALLPQDAEVLTVDVAGTEPELASTLRTAASDGSVVEIVYSTLSRGDTSVRAIEPWSVFTSLGNWYVSGYCRSAEDERVFRLDRIRSAKTTSATFEPGEHNPLPEVRYTPSEGDVICDIELKRSARWVAEYYPVDVLEDDDEVLLVRFSAYDPSVAAGLLLRLGAGARLVAGDEVMEKLKEVRSQMLNLYA